MSKNQHHETPQMEISTKYLDFDYDDTVTHDLLSYQNTYFFPFGKLYRKLQSDSESRRRGVHIACKIL